MNLLLVLSLRVKPLNEYHSQNRIVDLKNTLKLVPYRRLQLCLDMKDKI
jgi:hypothetical protein